jgi:hypothetical protein
MQNTSGTPYNQAVAATAAVTPVRQLARSTERLVQQAKRLLAPGAADHSSDV